MEPAEVAPTAPTPAPAPKPAAPAPSPDEDDPFAPAPAAPSAKPKAPPVRPAIPAPPKPDGDDPFAPLPAKPATPPAKPAADPAADPFKISAEAPRPIREWVDDTGLFHVRGRLIAIQGGKVRILKETGRTTTVPLSRLSMADRQYVDSQ